MFGGYFRNKKTFFDFFWIPEGFTYVSPINNVRKRCEKVQNSIPRKTQQPQQSEVVLIFVSSFAFVVAVAVAEDAAVALEGDEVKELG